eukprot:CAMPEP_0119052380 /NCGR_PEP_ID=MMETSP1177-20130426/73693_1 /TAXON_ID=2985 /ORGANISM="Ochromonas sp, Strain CCMP1899" /LENGTH=351 /DNA_ID=CAMNT_0007031927 /DNA_START=929 /DNA_END=1986 /DNA_ORIENTATION=-
MPSMFWNIDIKSAITNRTTEGIIREILKTDPDPDILKEWEKRVTVGFKRKKAITSGAVDLSSDNVSSPKGQGQVQSDVNNGIQIQQNNHRTVIDLSTDSNISELNTHARNSHNDDDSSHDNTTSSSTGRTYVRASSSTYVRASSSSSNNNATANDKKEPEKKEQVEEQQFSNLSSSTGPVNILQSAQQPSPYVQIVHTIGVSTSQPPEEQMRHHQLEVQESSSIPQLSEHILKKQKLAVEKKAQFDANNYNNININIIINNINNNNNNNNNNNINNNNNNINIIINNNNNININNNIKNIINNNINNNNNNTTNIIVFHSRNNKFKPNTTLTCKYPPHMHGLIFPNIIQIK